MTPDEIASAIVKGIAAGNTVTNNLLFGLVAMALIMLVVVLFSSIRSIGILMKFIMDMNVRSTSANEQSAVVGQGNIEALAKQSGTLHKQSGTLGDIVAAQEEIGGDVKLILTLSRSAGDKIVTLAKYAIAPTAQGKIDVKEIAEENTTAVDKPAAKTEQPPDTVEVTLPVQLIEKEKPE